METPLHRAFLQSVQIYPDGLAVSALNGSLTYRELDTKATHIGHFILTNRFRSCCFLLAPTPDYYVMLMACMKANCLAIPVDVSQPVHVIDEIIESVRPDAIFRDESLPWPEDALTWKGRIPDFILRQVTTENVEINDIHSKKENILLNETQTNSNPLLHCVFTSGSTGVAKKVYLGQKAILYDALSVWNTYNLKKNAALMNIGGYTSSLHLNAFWRCMINQGSFLSGQVKFEHPDLIKARIECASCTVLQAQPGILKTMFYGDGIKTISHINQIILGGENLIPSQVRQLQEWFPDLEYLTYNYSSTETMLICSMHDNVSRFLEWDRIPAGKPAPGKKILLVDVNRKEVMPGETGEIAVISLYLAEKIAPDSAPPKMVRLTESDEKIYYTGDLGRWNESGMLEHLGRNDRQLKIRSVRIDPVLVEEKMMQILPLTDVSVLGVQLHGTDYLAACIAPPLEDPAESLRARLSGHLPMSHIPQHFYYVESLPKTDRGKLDYNRMEKEITASILDCQNSSSDVTLQGDQIQKKIMDIWKEVVTGKTLSPNHSVFRQGADSLSVFLVLHEINAAFGLELTAQFFLAYPSMDSQAKQIAGIMGKEGNVITTLSPEQIRKKLGL